MFGAELVIGVAMAHLAAEAAFNEAMKALPPEVAQQMRRERAAAQEKARQEAEVERRHRELCDAIRSTSFWRFGG